ncbi:MAG: hypothetical protein IT306_12310 [Chloroflexi bacterium]|nr:hypothetical protein [Chloroflexota bacterium]
MPLSERAREIRDALAERALTPPDELEHLTTRRARERFSRRWGLAPDEWLGPLLPALGGSVEALLGSWRLYLPRIASDPALRDAVEALTAAHRTEPWVGVPAITGVGIGLTAGGGPDDFDLVVFGTHPAPLALLPQTFEGVRVRRRLGGAFVAAQRPPVTGGVSIGHAANVTEGGTLGCRVTDAQGRAYVLTAGHVLANGGRAAVGDGVVQPARCEGGRSPADLVATLDRLCSPSTGGTGHLVDAARALLDADHQGRVLPGVTQIGVLAGPRDTSADPYGYREAVRKYGQRSALTSGVVSVIGLRASVRQPSGHVAGFEDQVLVVGTRRRRFADQGDSGAVVVDGRQRVVGLLHAVDITQPSAVVTPIEHVIRALDVIL